MNCQTFRECVGGDAESARPNRAELARHVTSCRECQEQFPEVAWLLGDIWTEASDPPPPWVPPATHQETAPSQERRGLFSRLRRHGVPLAAASLLIGFGIVFLAETDERTTSDPTPVVIDTASGETAEPLSRSGDEPPLWGRPLRLEKSEYRRTIVKLQRTRRTENRIRRIVESPPPSHVHLVDSLQTK